MKSMRVQLVVLFLIVGLLSACASPATNTPASQPTEAAATEAPATATDTSAPAAGETPTAGAASGGASVSFGTDVMRVLESQRFLLKL